MRENRIRTIAMDGTEELVHGQRVLNTDSYLKRHQQTVPLNSNSLLHANGLVSHTHIQHNEKNTCPSCQNLRLILEDMMPEPLILQLQWLIRELSQLTEQISTLSELMDEFTSRIEELNSKISVNKVSASQQNLAVHTESCNGSGPTSLFMAGLGNGSLAGSLLPHSSSSSQLEEVLLIGKSQLQIMHQIDNLSNILRELNGPRVGRTEGMTEVVESIGVPLLLTLAIGGVGILFVQDLVSKITDSANATDTVD